MHGIGLTGPTRFVAAKTAHGLKPRRTEGTDAIVAPRVIIVPCSGFPPLPPFRVGRVCVCATQSAVANSIPPWIVQQCSPHVLPFQVHEVLHEPGIEVDLVDHQPVVNATNLAWSAMHNAAGNSDQPHSPELKNNWATPSRVTVLAIHEALGVATAQRVWQCGHTPAPSPRFATNGMCTRTNDECLVAHDLESSAPLRAMKHCRSVIVVKNFSFSHVQCQCHREPFFP